MKISKKLDFWVLQHLRVLRLGFCRARYLHRMEVDVAPETGTARDDILLFTAADSVYLERFLGPFTGSVVAHVPSPRLHVHLYNPQSRDFDRLERAQQQYPEMRLSWSHETFSSEDFERRVAASPRQVWKSLYICCSRFLAARALQNRTGASLLITDIDILFNADMKQRFSGEIDCALRLRPDEESLSKRALGGVVFASGNPIGRRFLARTCDYIERFLAAGFYWFAFDQYALFKAVNAIPAHERRHFSPLTAAEISLELAPDALILYPKGTLKHGEEYSSLAGTYHENSESKERVG